MGAPPVSPPPVENVSKVKAATITKFAAITGIVTIVVCYVLAVREGHVPKWLPMISDCAVYPPESYLFRVGIISSALMIFVTSVLFYFFLSSTTGRHRFDDKVGVFLAGLATLGLALVGAINEDENGTVHGASAVVFFTAFIFYMILSTVRLWRYKNPNFTVSKTSLTIKATTTVIGLVALIAFALMSSNWGKYATDIAICEWVGTSMILFFVLSYNLDFGDNEYVASLLVDTSAAVAPAAPAVVDATSSAV